MADSMMQYGRLLLAEDDLELAELTKEFLEGCGYAVEHVADGPSVLEAVEREKPALIILDIMLPGMDGMDVCRRLRPDFTNPILMMTARTDPLDEILGLEIGADDYLTKPVNPRRLQAHVRALLRRANTTPASDDSNDSNDLVVGPIRLDPTLRRAWLNDRMLPLTGPELTLLEALMKQPDSIITREDLFRLVKGIEYDGLNRAIDILVSQVRKHLDSAERIHTVRSRGYVLRSSLD